MKKLRWLLVLNLMSFGSIMSSVYFEFGFSLFIRLIIPIVVIFGTNLGAALSVFKAKNSM